VTATIGRSAAAVSRRTPADPGGRVRACPSGRGGVWPLPPACDPGVVRLRPRRRLRAECRHADAPDRHPGHSGRTSPHRQRAVRGDRGLRRRRLLSPWHAATPCGSVRRHRLEHRRCRGADAGSRGGAWVSTWSNCLSGTTSTTPRRSTGWCRRPPEAIPRHGPDTRSQRSGAGSSMTHLWREPDSNLQFRDAGDGHGGIG
jgi:hypothetical protein